MIPNPLHRYNFNDHSPLTPETKEPVRVVTTRTGSPVVYQLT